MSHQLKLAYYLPQFHEVEENNKWWGKGFTEWSNINASQSYFKLHTIRKPIEPLGQYNLLDHTILEQQYKLASENGIDGFLVWNYWFGENEKILERPIEAIINEESINFRFCFAWANHSWLNKRKGLLLKEQKYLGKEDYIDYFNYLIPFFKNKNYIKIENKPVFAIFRPQDIPDLPVFISLFQDMARVHGFSGIYFIAENTTGLEAYVYLFDSFCDSNCYLKNRYKNNPISFIKEKLSNKLRLQNLGPFVYDYKKLVQNYDYSDNKKFIPVIFTGWDTTPRHGRRGLVLINFNENSFQKHVNRVHKECPKAPIIIIKSWNEWAEGNLLEPDSIYSSNLLAIIRGI